MLAQLPGNPNGNVFDLGFLSNLPPQWTTFVVAMLPVSELRGAIPLAILKLGLSAPEAFLWSVLGNGLAGVLVVLFLEPVSKPLRRLPVFDRFFAWLFERTRRKHTQSFEKYQDVALFVFVAIPLPLTGAWTGAVAAFVFGVEKRSAISMIVLGVIAAGLVVTLVSTGAIQLNSFLTDLFIQRSR